MALFFGSSRMAVHLNGSSRLLNLATESQITIDNLLLSSDGFILTDSAGLYLSI